MIIDLHRFVAAERSCWTELETHLKKFESDPNFRMSLEDARRFHYLYERASAGLARIATFSGEAELRQYLENLVARAYGEIHETRSQAARLKPLHWLRSTLPQTFRRHWRAFALACFITAAGVLFGTAATVFDPESRSVTMPFGHDALSPEERVAQEEKGAAARLTGAHTAFSSYLMTHNTRVAVLTLSLGMTWGVGTLIVLFYNGVGLGAIGIDYILAGQTKFLMGWLMPHGVIEIPAILIAGQAGLMLAGALIGRGERAPMGARLRGISGDVVTLIIGVALMLIWAGLVESFLSQYHEPVIPYMAKILFGAVQLVLLILYLGWCGRGESRSTSKSEG
jgi:uncharacterized membrane protein SpoIIM required for sporulation